MSPQISSSNRFWSHFCVFTLAVSITFGPAHAPSDGDQTDEKHFEKVRFLLPPHSELPPILNLSEPEGNLHNSNRAWEDRFTGMMGLGSITDPGVAHPAGAGSISTTTTEYATPIWALPARSCDLIAIATPVSSDATLSYNRRFVYSVFHLRATEILKGDKPRTDKEKLIRAAQFGGTVRFPSGHLETFLMAEEGFIQKDRSYLLFVWKPVQSDDTYVVSEPYLIDGGKVYPVRTEADVSPYDGMPFEKFKAKVKSAIARNVDTN